MTSSRAEFEGRFGALSAFSTDRAGVDAFYEAALAAGGTNNGAPGIRAHFPN
jgi:hypothetical protein